MPRYLDVIYCFFFFFNDTATTEIYTLSLHDALPIYRDEVNPEGDTIEDLITNLADRYLNINCACFTPNEGRIDDILRYVKEYNIDGVVYSNLSFCHTYSVEYNRVEKALKEAGIPMINIETDYSTEDSGQIKTRVEAFIEMI